MLSERRLRGGDESLIEGGLTHWGGVVLREDRTVEVW